MKDLIDERDRREKIAHSIIKRWNVHYMSPEEVEAMEEEKHQQEVNQEEVNRQEVSQEDLDRANEILARLEAEAAADEAKKQEEIERAKFGQIGEDTYNPTTNSFSGTYGQQKVEDEATNARISQILGEKDNAFEKQLQETLEEMQEEKNGKQDEEQSES